MIFTIRTGPADFSHRLVMRREHGGYLPSTYSVKDCHIWCDGVPFETPEETDVFDVVGIKWVEPWSR